MHFQLFTLDGIKFDETVYEVILPTLDGQIGVLKGHMPLITVATNGVISVRVGAKDLDSKMEHFASFGGVIEVDGDSLRVIVDEADRPEEINQAEAQKAFDLAKKMKASAKDEVSLEHAQGLMDRHSVRLQVANLRRHTKRQ